ncbi:peroxisome biogenesis factor 1, partial [Ancylostoma caninum]
LRDVHTSLLQGSTCSANSAVQALIRAPCYQFCCAGSFFLLVRPFNFIMGSTSYPVFLLFHDLPNCFTYAKTLSINSDDAILSSKGLSNTFLGYFCVRSCEDPQKQFYVQMFGSFPLTHIFVNRTFAELAGLRSNEEVLIEAVATVTCASISIVPVSQHDYEIFDKSSGQVENVFLQQIHVVFPGMRFPLWISPSVCASFRIAHVTPSTNQAVLLVPSTELHVLPLFESEKTSTTYSGDINNKGLVKLGETFPNVLNNGSTSYLSSPLRFSGDNFRVLPSSLVEADKIFPLIHPNVIYIPAVGLSNYIACNIVSVKSQLNPSTVDFAVAVSLPGDSTSGGSPSGSLADILKSKPGHCIVSSRDYLAYSVISLTSLEEQQMRLSQHVNIFFQNDDWSWLMSGGKQYELYNILHEMVSIYPILLSDEGRSISIVTAGRRLMVRLVPAGIRSCPSHRRCFVADVACDFKLKVDPGTVHSTAVDLSEPENYGLMSNVQSSNIECQSDVVNELTAWVRYCWSHKKFGHALLLGPDGSGKTSLTTLFANRLARSSYGCLCTRIECSGWKGNHSALVGKQSETIEKSLASELLKLSCRKPSLLILDDFDFIEASNEEEHRQIDIEKIFQVLLRLLSSCTVPVLVTAKQLKFVHKSLVMLSGRRFFAVVVYIPPLSQALEYTQIQY